MANFAGARIRTNSVFGTVSDNPLLIGATTLNGAALVDLAAVSSNHAVIVLDPLRVAGAPEIVIVTAHTAAATSATITRAAYGTTARQHVSGTLWIHAPTIDDLIQICTSGTRPADVYRGQLIFETDTNSYVGRDTSDAWQTVVQLGAWTAFTPVVKFGTTTATLSANNTQYHRVGRKIVMQIMVKLSTLNAGTGNLTITLPVAVRAPAGTLTYVTPIGVGSYVDGGTGAVYPCIVTPNAATDLIYRTTNAQPSVVCTHAVPKALVATDEIHATVAYEAVS